MDETAEKEIRRLKSDLLKKKGEVEDIRALVNREIDREFQTEALDLVERELEPFIEKSLTDIKENLALKAEPDMLRSHRRILGRPVLFFKKTFMSWVDLYTRMILDKQNQYNRSSFDLLKVVLLRSRWSREKLKDLEERLAECEESLVVMINKVDDLQARLEKGNEPAAKE
jgi:BMFP domain-containing protein YqiC